MAGAPEKAVFRQLPAGIILQLIVEGGLCDLDTRSMAVSKNRIVALCADTAMAFLGVAMGFTNPARAEFRLRGTCHTAGDRHR